AVGHAAGQRGRLRPARCRRRAARPGDAVAGAARVPHHRPARRVHDLLDLRGPGRAPGGPGPCARGRVCGGYAPAVRRLRVAGRAPGLPRGVTVVTDPGQAWGWAVLAVAVGGDVGAVVRHVLATTPWGQLRGMLVANTVGAAALGALLA